MNIEFYLKKSKAAALNEALRLKGIQIGLYEKNEDNDWYCEIDTIEHDKKVEEFIVNVCIATVEKYIEDREQYLLEKSLVSKVTHDDIKEAFSGIIKAIEKVKDRK